MGCDCATKVADLFLLSMVIFQRQSPKLLSVIHVLKYCSRYYNKDDLNVPEVSKEICRIICNEIYPEELSIERTNTD